MPRDRADHRAREAVQAQRHRVDPLDHLALLRRSVGRDRLQVSAGGEEPFAPSQDQGSRWVRSKSLQGGDDRTQQRDVDCIAGGRSTASTAMPPESVSET